MRVSVLCTPRDHLERAGVPTSGHLACAHILPPAPSPGPGA
jgi:hypothetical protein